LSIKFVVKLLACLLLAGTFSLPCAAQQTTLSAAFDSSVPTPQDTSKQTESPQQTPSQSTTSQQTSSQETSDRNKSNPDTGGKVEGTSNDRLFYTLPNFLSVQNGKLPPLTVKDKFKVVALGNFDFIQYPWWGIVAAIGQAYNSEPQFRQGWLAYAKRYGTTAGDSSVENFMVGAVFPSILHQDPRFYQSSTGNFWRRSGYGVSRIFVTRTDSGHSQFNYSEIFGAATAAAVSDYSYHPRSTYVVTPTNPHEFVPSDRTFRNTLSVWYTQVALDTVTIEVKEFWPDIHRKMSRKHSSDSAIPKASNP
jgi:hypothetical protein